jgi:hypothetical protein
MAISNSKAYILKAEYTHSDTVALTQAAANAAVADYTVADLIDLVNTAIAGEYVVTVNSIGKASSVQA